MPQVIKAKNAIAQEAFQYGPLMPFDFDVITLVTNQLNSSIANAQPIGIAMKVIMLSVMMTTVNGSAPVSVNLTAGTAPETGLLGPTDPLFLEPNNGVPGGAVVQGGYPPLASQMMTNGSSLWTTDQPLNGASAPVANTIYNLYPVAGMWDAIWSNALPITLRVVTGAAASGGVLKAVAYVSLVDIHPNMPNAFNPFAPSNLML